MPLKGLLTAGAPLAPAAWFDAMADAAIRGSELVVAGERFTILEVEFYLRRADHPDPYVHGSEQQVNTNGEWYFHREKAARLGFTLKGLDVTFGPAGEAGGMLIRALAKPTGGGYVEGPSLVVDTILRAAGVESVAELKGLAAYTNDVFAPAGLLRIEGRAGRLTDPIHAGPRIGLKGGKPYADAPYRYRARPALTRKDKGAILAGRRVPSPPPTPPPTLPTPPLPLPSPAPAASLTDSDLESILS